MAWNHDIGELPPPKTLEIKSAGINLGGLSPSGSPLLHCYDSHWPGAPFLLVPSDRHDEHYSNKPRSMRHVCNFQLVPSLRAHPRVHSVPTLSTSNTNPSHPESQQGEPFLQDYQQYRLQQQLRPLSQAYQITRSKVLSEGIISRELKGGGGGAE